MLSAYAKTYTYSYRPHNAQNTPPSTTTTALVVHPDSAAATTNGRQRGKKRATLANAGKAVFKVLGLPIKTVLGGLRKLLSLAKGGRGRAGRGGKGPQAVIGQHPHRPVTFVDLDALGEEERGMVEETYQGALCVYMTGRIRAVDIATPHLTPQLPLPSPLPPPPQKTQTSPPGPGSSRGAAPWGW